MKITFANISLTLDFKTKEEAEEYKSQNLGKGWWFSEIWPLDLAKTAWTMEVRRPYRHYNPGW